MESKAKAAGKKASKAVNAVVLFTQFIIAIIAVTLSFLTLVMGHFLSSGAFLVAAIIVFPTSLNFVRAFLNGSPGTGIVTGLFITCLIVGMTNIGDVAYKKENATKVLASEERRRDEARQQFITNKITILNEVSPYASSGNLSKVKDLTDKYSFIEDYDLIEVRKKAEINYLIAELKRMPASKVEANLNSYKRLATLVPDEPRYKKKVKTYQAKVEIYQAKVDKKRAGEAPVVARKEDIKKQFSSWDGSHRNVEKAIKANMHNPNSYDHVETVYWDRGDHLVVQTTFRGTNAFGAIVTNNAKAVVATNGTVLSLE